jgi:hypothetical protein
MTARLVASDDWQPRQREPPWAGAACRRRCGATVGRHELSHVIRTANRVEGFRVVFAPRQIEQRDQLIPIQCHRSAPRDLRIVAVGPSTTLRAGTRPRTIIQFLERFVEPSLLRTVARIQRRR